MSHAPGLFHPWTLDGSVHVDVNGIEHGMWELDDDHAERVLLWLLRNADRFRCAYLREVRGVNYPIINSDSKQWMLRTKLARHLMRRIAL